MTFINQSKPLSIITTRFQTVIVLFHHWQSVIAWHTVTGLSCWSPDFQARALVAVLCDSWCFCAFVHLLHRTERLEPKALTTICRIWISFRAVPHKQRNTFKHEHHYGYLGATWLENSFKIKRYSSVQIHLSASMCHFAKSTISRSTNHGPTIYRPTTNHQPTN